MQQHNLFKPKSFEEARNGVVGECNGYTMQQRYELETPLFARAIKRNIKTRNDGGWALVLDYGCGCGRLAKSVASREEKISVKGTDASQKMMDLAYSDIGDPYIFQTWNIKELSESNIKFDVAYLIYVLQHVPSIEIREILQRIYDNLKEDGTFIYCSSDYRMCIRFDGQGFFDDRFLGVNLQEEIERYFEKIGPLFTDQEFKDNEILRRMVLGEGNNLPHPAFVYKKRKLVGELYNAIPEKKSEVDTKTGILHEHLYEGKDKERLQCSCGDVKDFSNSTSHKKEYTKLVLINRLAPGDILVMTNAIRDLHKAYPGKYQTEVRSPCNAIFDNSPYHAKLTYDEGGYQKEEGELHKGDRNGHKFVIGDVLFIDMHYPIIHESGTVGWHFSHGHTMWLEEVLGVPIKKTDIRPEIYLSQSEHDWISPVLSETGNDKPYWVINAGSKGDYTLKQYPYYQEVVDILKDKVQFVQIGLKGHNHIPLRGVIDMVGKTGDTRKLFRVINSSLGVLTCVSFPLHIAAAFSKPCVVVAGGREGTRWELYPSHRFLYTNGCLPCCPWDGCWKSKMEDCTNKVDNISKCMTLIKPQAIADSILMYYAGGILQQ